LTPDEQVAIRRLAEDIPTLWTAPTTTAADRQAIARLMLERVVITVAGTSEKVAVVCHWAGGVQTHHSLRRPVARVSQLSTHAALRQRIAKSGAKEAPPHPLADAPGLWVRDPDGTHIQVIAADKVSPATRDVSVSPPPPTPGKGAAPSRSKAGKARPQRLSHVLLFSPDVPRSVRFYSEALGLRLSDNSGDIIAFMHGAHASDHHMLAFAKSDAPGLHHSSWAVPSIEDVGIGMQQMEDAGYKEGWGVGRHVIGSNYFRYIRDPWGSFAEYSAGIDFIGADDEWIPQDHPLEDSFYVWGPSTPDYFIENHESPARGG